ncbi:MAG: phosphoenolpyruvate kinase, partial [Deltaproteobacteria bacterium]|nr:phosphoenolpyruvate kinase [Nannocystaceae bacterium]
MTTPGDHDDLLARLRGANAGFARHYVGARALRQPLHTVYWGAHRMRPDTFVRLGEAAREVFDAYAEDPGQLARALDFP